MTLASGSSTFTANRLATGREFAQFAPITLAQLISVYRGEEEQLAYRIVETFARAAMPEPAPACAAGELAVYMNAIAKTRLQLKREWRCIAGGEMGQCAFRPGDTFR